MRRPSFPGAWMQLTAPPHPDLRTHWSRIRQVQTWQGQEQQPRQGTCNAGFSFAHRMDTFPPKYATLFPGIMRVNTCLSCYCASLKRANEQPLQAIFPHLQNRSAGPPNFSPHPRGDRSPSDHRVHHPSNQQVPLPGHWFHPAHNRASTQTLTCVLSNLYKKLTITLAGHHITAHPQLTPQATAIQYQSGDSHRKEIHSCGNAGTHTRLVHSCCTPNARSRSPYPLINGTKKSSPSLSSGSSKASSQRR